MDFLSDRTSCRKFIDQVTCYAIKASKSLGRMYKLSKIIHTVAEMQIDWSYTVTQKVCWSFSEWHEAVTDNWQRQPLQRKLTEGLGCLKKRGKNPVGNNNKKPKIVLS